MTLQEAEIQKAHIEHKLKAAGFDLEYVNILIAPTSENEFWSFRKRWRESTYVYALANFGHCDMSLYVEDLKDPSAEFERLGDFAAKTGVDLSGG
ncbi:MAG: hypothetical protein EOP49_04870 [Sphingobacteriales bacterium]|nr:MAG: hypothetical protein EOP49_04870 [Sphingobacteriales bacterium]